jgi:hypothetical protein
MLSPTALLPPPYLTALGLIGPSKKDKTKYNIWITGKQPRSLKNIYLETLFVTKPYESSPPPQRLGQISGGPYVQCFSYKEEEGDRELSVNRTPPC